MSCDFGQRRVFQAYRRLGEEASPDNPYPTLFNAAQEIEDRGLQPTADPWSEIERPRAPPSDLQPLRSGLDPYLGYDQIALAYSQEPRSSKEPERTAVYKNGQMQDLTPTGYERITDPGREGIKTKFKPADFRNAEFVRHRHPDADGFDVPGDGDWLVPARLGVPLYGQTKEGMFRVNPPGADGRLTMTFINTDMTDSLSSRANEAMRALNREMLSDEAQRRRRQNGRRRP